MENGKRNFFSSGCFLSEILKNEAVSIAVLRFLVSVFGAKHCSLVIIFLLLLLV